MPAKEQLTAVERDKVEIDPNDLSDDNTAE